MKEEQVTYAYYDIIHTKRLLLEKNGSDKIAQLWNRIDWFVNNPSDSDFSTLFLEGKNCKQTPEIHVIAFSDSFLLYTKPEFIIDDFYKIARRFKEIIEENLKCYCIINRDKEIKQSCFPASGGHSLDDANIPLYYQITGVGPAWVNIYLSENFIRKQKEWNERYSLYCVGEQSKPKSIKPNDMIEGRGVKGNLVKVFALE